MSWSTPTSRSGPGSEFPTTGARYPTGVSPTALVRGEDLQLRDDGSAFRVFFGDESVDVCTPLLGSFNVSMHSRRWRSHGCRA